MREPAEVAAADAQAGEGPVQNEPSEEHVPGEALPEEPEALLAHWRQRVLSNGADIEARRELGRLYNQRGELQQAVEQFEAAKAAAPEDPGVLLGYAEAQVGLRRFEAAERELRRLLRIQPDNGAAHLLLGTASFRRGLYAQAEQELRRAVDLLPESALAHFYRGEALNQLDRVDEALAMLERAVQLDPSNSRAYYVIGILHDKKGRPHEAATYFRKAREVANS